MNTKKLKMRIVMLSLFFVSVFPYLHADELKSEIYTNLADLSVMYRNYVQELDKLYKKYRGYKKDGNDEEKEKTKKKLNLVRDEFKKTIEEFNQKYPLKGKELAYKVVSRNLPFEVQSVTIDKVTPATLYFIVRVKMNQDIKNPDGELSQRISIHFVAVDLDNKIIPHTWNWATNHGWIKLKKDTIYEAQGHWNAKRVQNMNNFSFLKIMSKADYKKMKESK